MTSTNYEIIENAAKETIRIETAAIENLINYIDNDFCACVETIYKSAGRVVITGIGKSAIIGQKIVATLNSTGTPALFMHAADAIHGDLGMIQEDDIVICISKSGTTPEIMVLIPLIKRFKNKIAAIVSNTDSFLAKQADFILRATVAKEACPNNLAPTSSTTAQLVIGDAIASCLLQLKGFTSSDFAQLHPGGALGKRLYLRVNDLYINNAVPSVDIDAKLENVIFEISSKRLGATAVIDNDGNLAGMITDGDLRRMLQRKINFHSATAKDIMTKSPKTISADALAVQAFNIMEKNNITQLIVMKDDKYAGIVHLHDILREGII